MRRVQTPSARWATAFFVLIIYLDGMFLLKRSFLLLSLLTWRGGAFVYAISIPQNAWWVTDLAEIFTPEQEVLITQQLVQIASWFDAEIAVLTLPTLEGEDIDMAWTQIAQERWIGNKERDTWVLILIAPNERKWRIDVGYGLEGNLPDAYAYRYGENYLVPAFKEWRYADGVLALLTKFEEHLDGKPDTMTTNGDDSIFGVFFVGAMVMFIVVAYYKSKSAIKQSKAIWALGMWSAVLALLCSPFVSWIAGILFFFWFLGSIVFYVAPVVQSGPWSRGSFGGWGSFSGWFWWFWWWSFGGWGASGGR